jgi:hypothetical protein
MRLEETEVRSCKSVEAYRLCKGFCARVLIEESLHWMFILKLLLWLQSSGNWIGGGDDWVLGND